MYQESKECCGTCRYHQKEGGEWVCTNSGSDYYSDYTGYEDECECWEGRK